MILCHNLSLNLADLNILDNVGLKLDANERVFILGRNGMGKSTLLKLLAGKIQPDSGKVEINKEWKVGYLPQDIPTDLSGTVYAIVASGLAELTALFQKYHAAAHASPPNLAVLDQCQQAIEARGAWEIQHRIDTVISKLGLPSDTEFSSLSGGLKRRVLLAQALVSQPNVLLLDEPTNHMDVESIRWLEQHLLNYAGCLVIVSHDRAFMEKLATRILEIDRGKFYSYPGRYSDFIRYKASDLLAEEAANQRFDKKLADEEVWIRQGVKARRTRNEGRVRALEQLRRDRSLRREKMKTATFSLNNSDEIAGEQVITAHKISFSYQDKMIVHDFSTKICRGDKIGIIGPNGCGKTTLLNLLLGKLQPEAGTVKLGTKLSIAYFDQLRADIKPGLSVRENLAQGSDKIIVNGKSKHVVSYLNDFLFSSKQIGMPASNLSGGQFNRLLLAKLLVQPANLFVLDEPTNDLDIETLELLEELLTQFSGTLLIVSHDRAFLDNVITSALVFRGNGLIEETLGNYDDGLQQTTPLKPNKDIPKSATPPKPKTKLSFNEQRELDQLPKKIETLEQKIKHIHDQMGESGFYQQSADVLKNTQTELDNLEHQLEQAFARWEALDRFGN